MDGQRQYYLYNAHGDVVQRTDGKGVLLKRYEYDAFGNEREAEEKDGNPWRYCGEYWDAGSGTYYLRARYYEPKIGRFLSEDTHWNPGNMLYGDNPMKINEHQAEPNDPLGLNTYTFVPDVHAITQSSNRYVYVINDPIRYIDLDGKVAVLALAGTGTVGKVFSGTATVAGTNFWNPIGWIAAGAAIVIVAIVAGVLIYNAHKDKTINLPSIKKIKINMNHIMSGHSAGGNRGGPNKDRFPGWMTAPMIEKAIKEAYQGAQKIGSYQYSWKDGVEQITQLFEGPWGKNVIQFYFNHTKKLIETAWPK